MRFLAFGFLGLMATLVYTGIRGAISKRGFDFTGEASLILFPLFGLIAVLYPFIAIHTGGFPWYGRGAIYMAAFFLAQYLIGLVLSKLNLCPWQYAGSGSLGGLIRVADAPIWFAAGLGVEWVYPYVRAIANTL